jgi:hypothetical protein
MDVQINLLGGSATSAGFTTFRFQNAAFLGLKIAELSDTFTNGGLTPSLVGDTLTLTWNGEFIGASPDTRDFDRAAVYEFSSAPEPGSALLLLSGTAGLIFAMRRTARIRTKHAN